MRAAFKPFIVILAVIITDAGAALAQELPAQSGAASSGLGRAVLIMFLIVTVIFALFLRRHTRHYDSNESE